MRVTIREMRTEDIASVAGIGTESSQSPWTEKNVLSYFLREDTLFMVAEAADGEAAANNGTTAADSGTAADDEAPAGSGGEAAVGSDGEAPAGSGGEAPALLGFTALLLTPPESDVLDIVVQREYRGRGIGRKLLDTACDYALLAGVDTTFLEVRPSNTPARRLYARLGFTQCGIRKAYYTDPAEDAIAMVRRRNIISLSPADVVTGP